MGKQHEALNDKLTTFIEAQKVYFVATAGAEGRVNLSPKGLDSLRILDHQTVVWLNLTGSGNETSAHVQENGRMTIMFCAFDGKPLILRLYGQAQVFHEKDPGWAEYIALFPQNTGNRQIFKLNIDLVQTSCGFGVPLYNYVTDRDLLDKFSETRGRDGIKEYWKKKNQLTLDGKPTHILEKSDIPQEISE